MSLEIKTFKIRDDRAAEDESVLRDFLHRVKVTKMDTAYSEGGWRLLIQYEDKRYEEEREQIESAIIASLSMWRSDMAKKLGIDKQAVLSDLAMADIAKVAPTTAIEAASIPSPAHAEIQRHCAEIVGVVRETLADLTDDVF